MSDKRTAMETLLSMFDKEKHRRDCVLDQPAEPATEKTGGLLGGRLAGFSMSDPIATNTITAEQVSAAFKVLAPHLDSVEFMSEEQLRKVVHDMLDAARAKA